MEQTDFNQFLFEHYSDPKYIEASKSIAAQYGIDNVVEALKNNTSVDATLEKKSILMSNPVNMVYDDLTNSPVYTQKGDNIISMIVNKAEGKGLPDQTVQGLSFKSTVNNEALPELSGSPVMATLDAFSKSNSILSRAINPQGLALTANKVANYLGLGIDVGALLDKRDPTFDTRQYIKDNHLETYADQFETVYNKTAADTQKAFIEKVQKDAQFYSPYSTENFIGANAGMIADPIFWAAGAPVKTIGIANRVAAYTANVASAMAVQQGSMLITDPLLTEKQATINIAAGALLGATIGLGSGLLHLKADRFSTELDNAVATKRAGDGPIEDQQKIPETLIAKRSSEAQQVREDLIGHYAKEISNLDDVVKAESPSLAAETQVHEGRLNTNLLDLAKEKYNELSQIDFKHETAQYTEPYNKTYIKKINNIDTTIVKLKDDIKVAEGEVLKKSQTLSGLSPENISPEEQQLIEKSNKGLKDLQGKIETLNYQKEDLIKTEQTRRAAAIEQVKTKLLREKDSIFTKYEKRENDIRINHTKNIASTKGASVNTIQEALNLRAELQNRINSLGEKSPSTRLKEAVENTVDNTPEKGAMNETRTDVNQTTKENTTGIAAMAGNFEAVEAATAEDSKLDTRNILQKASQWISSKTNVAGSIFEAPYTAVREFGHSMTESTINTLGELKAASLPSIRQFINSDVGQMYVSFGALFDTIKPLLKTYDHAELNHYVMLVSSDAKNLAQVPSEIRPQIKEAAGYHQEFFSDQRKQGQSSQYKLFPEVDAWKIKKGQNYIKMVLDRDAQYDPEAQAFVIDSFNKRIATLDKIIDDPEAINELKQAISNLSDRQFAEARLLQNHNLRLQDKELLSNVKAADDYIAETNKGKDNVIPLDNERLKSLLKKQDLEAIKKDFPEQFKLIANDIADNIIKVLKEDNALGAEKQAKDWMYSETKDPLIDPNASNSRQLDALMRNKRLMTYSEVHPVVDKNIYQAMHSSAINFGIAKGMKLHFNDTNINNVLSKQYAKLDEEAKAKFTDIAHNENLTNDEKVIKRKELAHDIEYYKNDMKTMAELQFGYFQRDGAYTSKFFQYLRSFKNILTGTMLAGATPSQLPELGAVTYYRAAMGNIHGIQSLGLTFDRIADVSKRDAMSVGVAFDEAIADIHWNSKLQEADPRGGQAGWFEGKTRQFTTGVMYGNGMTYMSGAIKRIAYNGVINNMLTHMDHLVLGKATPEEILQLNHSHIGIEQAQHILEQVKEHGIKDADGSFHLNEALWDKEAKDMMGFTFNEINKFVAHPVPENMPKYLSTQVGAFVFAFQSYSFSNQQQRVLFNMQQLSRNRAQAMANMLITTNLGILGVYAKKVLKNQPAPIDAKLIYQGIMYGGVLGNLGDASQLAQAALYGQDDSAIWRQTIPAMTLVSGVKGAYQSMIGNPTPHNMKAIVGVTGLDKFLWTGAFVNGVEAEYAKDYKQKP